MSTGSDARHFTPHWSAFGRSVVVRACVCLQLALLFALLPACGPKAIEDPVKALNTVGVDAGVHLTAIHELAAQDPMTRETSKLLLRVMMAPNYNQKVRELAFNTLAEKDRKALIETLQTSLGRSESFEFRRWVLEQIGERGWKDFTVVIVNSWANPVPPWGNVDIDRPEYAAMLALYGPRTPEGRPQRQALTTDTNVAVVDALFAVLMDSHPIRQAALRARTWELLMRMGQRERLKELVASTAYRPDDVMLRDIRQLDADLGILPETREELLWLAKLRQTASPAYWKLAGEALRQIPESDKRGFELRGVSVAIAAAKYKPEMLHQTKDELYQQVAARLKARGAGKYGANFQGHGEGHTEILAMQKDEVTWTDLAAMTLAIDMAEQSAIRAKLFDIGDRDQQDRRTEYGGVIRINDSGEYEVLEIRPRVQGSDARYEAPQEVFDAGYTAIFHFHFHAQSFENGSYAGPHMGDFAYAASTRANCLVFSFVKRSALNIDFYRHGPVVVDLGILERE
jgi:hypothetical protein